MVELDIPQEAAETEQQQLARLRFERSQRELRAAPDLITYVRSLSVNGQVERGEVLPEWSAPMRLGAADASDEAYAQLLNWVKNWSEDLNIAPPAASVMAWRNSREAQGFRAGTTPEGAFLLVRLNTMWLLTRAEQIAAFADRGEASRNAVVEYQDDVARIVRELRLRFPMAPRPARDVLPRPCPVCDEPAVGAEWASEDVRDVKVWCGACGHEIPAKAYSRVLGWLA